MLNIPAESYLKTNTMIFAQKMCQSISDMIGISFNVREDTLKEAGFKSPFKMISYISFSGAIQGNYLCAMDEATALKIIGAYNEGMNDDEIRKLRGDHSGFVKEVLNLSVGQSIVEIEKNFGDLTFFPGTVVYGELEFPDFLSADVQIENEFGSILCGFSLNLANLKIGQKLDEALGELEKKTSEAQEAKRNISSILELLPVGLVAIDHNGTILPGHSKSTKSVIGIEYDAKITGLYLPDLLQIEKRDGLIWKNWLELVYTKYGKIPFEDLSSLCELKEIKNSKGKTLKLDWLAITDEKQEKLEKLLVVIEDVTRQRELEVKMEELNKKHQENLDLISQVINLNPDEVTDFIYDSSQLLADAQRIVGNNNRDREFVNNLFSAFYTLKGSSGQYQFKSMQEIAHTVENHLRNYSNDNDFIDDDIVNEVKNSIENAKSYLNRIQDIRAKLGNKDESLRDKARRDPATVMVSLSELNDIIVKCKNVLSKISVDVNDSGCVGELDRCCTAIGDLKKKSLSFFLPSFEMLLKNSSDKLNKKATISIVNDIKIDADIMRVVHQCLIHIINNAIDHGVEYPEERIAAGKIEHGVLLLSGYLENNRYVIALEDDGRGINIPAVRKKIIQDFHESEQSVNGLTDDQLYEYLFRPGLTTKDSVTMLSGRGIGMDFVHKTVTKYGGTIKVWSVASKGTKITLSIPSPEV